jgi:hypothetical protein
VDEVLNQMRTTCSGITSMAATSQRRAFEVIVSPSEACVKRRATGEGFVVVSLPEERNIETFIVSGRCAPAPLVSNSFFLSFVCEALCRRKMGRKRLY